jgi:hypothetical protein
VDKGAAAPEATTAAVVGGGGVVGSPSPTDGALPMVEVCPTSSAEASPAAETGGSAASAISKNVPPFKHLVSEWEKRLAWKPIPLFPRFFQKACVNKSKSGVGEDTAPS